MVVAKAPRMKLAEATIVHCKQEMQEKDDMKRQRRRWAIGEDLEHMIVKVDPKCMAVH